MNNGVNMKNLFLLLFIAFFLESCSSSENPTEADQNTLIGKWQRIKETTIDSSGTTVRNPDSSGWDNILLTFYEDGTWVQGGDVNRSGTYTTNGNKLYITRNSTTTETIFEFISSNKLKLTSSYMDLNNNPVQVITEWNKI